MGAMLGLLLSMVLGINNIDAIGDLQVQPQRGYISDFGMESNTPVKGETARKVFYGVVGYEETTDENVIMVKYKVWNNTEKDFIFKANTEYTEAEQRIVDEITESLNERNDTACDELLYQLQLDDVVIMSGSTAYGIKAVTVEDNWKMQRVDICDGGVITVTRDKDKYEDELYRKDLVK